MRGHRPGAKILILLVALCSISFAQTTLAQVYIDIVNPVTGNAADQDPIFASPGDTITLPIVLTSGGNSVLSFSTQIDYDPIAFMITSVNLVQTDLVISITSYPGVLNIDVSGPFPIADGSVAIVTLDVDINAAAGDHTLANTSSSFDADGAALVTTGSDAVINITAAPLSALITGSVYAADTGDKISGATVTVYLAGTEVCNFTAPDGDYLCQTPAGSNYTITASAQGYQIQPKTIDSLSGGETRVVNFCLLPNDNSIGNINKDGGIDVLDSIVLLRYLAGLETLGTPLAYPAEYCLMDLNRDEEITLLDVIKSPRLTLDLD